MLNPYGGATTDERHFRARYPGTQLPNLDDPSAGQHEWPTPDAVVAVGPETARQLVGHELFVEVAPAAETEAAPPPVTPVTEPSPIRTAPAVEPVTEPDPTRAPAEAPDAPDEGDNDDDGDEDPADTETPAEPARRRTSGRKQRTRSGG